MKKIILLISLLNVSVLLQAGKAGRKKRETPGFCNARVVAGSRIKKVRQPEALRVDGLVVRFAQDCRLVDEQRRLEEVVSRPKAPRPWAHGDDEWSWEVGTVFCSDGEEQDSIEQRLSELVIADGKRFVISAVVAKKNKTKQNK